MTILGIDPGYGIVGWGVINNENGQINAIDYGVIETPKTESLAVRLSIIYYAMKDLIAKFKPDQVAIEELFFFRNYTTAIPVAEARGILVLAANEACGNIFEYTPLQIKQAITGHGRAEKKQMQMMVKAILGLDKIPKPDDAADALAVAICHSQINPSLNTNRM